MNTTGWIWNVLPWILIMAGLVIIVWNGVNLYKARK
jgi:hypothetical protein